MINCRKPGKWLKDDRGFTLIEAICALGLLVVVIFGFTILVTAASKNNISAAKLRSSYDTGIKAMAADWTSEVDKTNTNLILKVGSKDITIPVRKESTKKTGDTIYLEKFVPVK